MAEIYINGFIYPAHIGAKLFADFEDKTCALHLATEMAGKNPAEEIAKFEKDYWHAMRAFALREATLTDLARRVVAA